MNGVKFKKQKKMRDMKEKIEKDLDPHSPLNYLIKINKLILYLIYLL